MNVLKINAQKPYEVVITNTYESLSEKIKNIFNGKKILLITDSNVEPYYSSEILNILKNYEIYKFVILAGELSKNADNYVKILSFMAQNLFTREDAVLALGGGVVGDLSGFVAATYMRGITLIQCPTTLLSDVDSSVGGKTAIDLAEGKNLVGTFYQPSITFINISVLKTLPESEIICGMGEVVKYAFISESVSKNLIKNGISEVLIYECLKVKATLVEKDEFDRGDRIKLNLGHTIGHAIEALSGYTLPHGLCVAKGIGKIIDISKRYYSLPDNTVEKLKNLLNVFHFELNIPFSAEEIANKVLSDKKAENSFINFVLIKDIGQVEKVKIPVEMLEKIVK